MQFSANLGFLFRDLSLPDAIRAAKRQGFSGVEMHWPYDTEASVATKVLRDAGLPLLCINTSRGDVAAGDFGLSALPGREEEARAAIDQSLAWAAATGCRNVHVMAGKASGATAFATFAENLRYAAGAAVPHGIGLLIEPLNPRDAPDYFLSDMTAALRVIDAVGGGVGIMFDCYHMQVVHGDLLRTVEAHLSAIGHIQIAAVPDRAEPDHGEIDYGWLLPAIAAAGYAGQFGAEYRPASSSFGWMDRLTLRQS